MSQPFSEEMQDRINKLQEDVQRYKQEAEKLIKERSEYLLISSHQMKSPLNTISFSVDTLLGEYAGRLTTKQLRVLESIKRNIDFMQSLIRDIMELERFRSGQIEKEKVNFTEICFKTIEELRNKIQEKEIYFEVNIPQKSLLTLGNGVGLKHVVFNLLENAIKYSHQNGEVSFSVKYDEKQKTITGEVRDKGIGIPENEQVHIFEDFYRASNARKFDRTGTGFGMVIVKQVLDFCRGSIKIQSRENQGTKVTFSLPLFKVMEGKVSPEAKRTPRKRIVVIGGVAAGPKAASRARRLDPEAYITLFEKGYFLAYAGCALPYYISGRIRSQRDLTVALTGFQGATEYFRNVKGIEIKNLCEVININREQKSIQYRDVLTERVYSEPYDTLIIATGSNPTIPEINGVDLQNIFVLHGMHDSERIKLALADNMAKDIVIVGGGLIGVETAEALTVSGARVTIVERKMQILDFLDGDMAALVERHMEQKGIRIIKKQDIIRFAGDKKVEVVELLNLKLPADLVILTIGTEPNVELAQKAGLKIGETGAVEVNEFLQTSDPSIYAIGDCAETRHAITGKPYYLPLGSIANRQGRVAGSNAAGMKYVFGPVSGTIIIKVFDYNVAKTGLSEAEAKQAGFDLASCYVPEYDREPFIPGAEIINIKLTACKKTKKLLGSQIVGKGDVAKRIDIAATVISKSGTVEDLLSVDLGYAPVYSNAMGAIIVSANVLQNKLNGLFDGITSDELNRIMTEKQDGYYFLDVRTPQEFEEERIPGFDSIPLEELRRRIDELPRNSTITVVCESGARSYQASLILKAHGYTSVRVLEGGLRMWPFGLTHE